MGARKRRRDKRIFAMQLRWRHWWLAATRATQPNRDSAPWVS